MRLGLMNGLLAFAVGCGSAARGTGDGDYMDDDLPMGNCAPTGGCPPGGAPAGSVPVGSACAGPEECTQGSGCVAPWAAGEVGAFTCSATCVPNDDESMWCLGASACCDPEAVCNPRGLCRPASALDDMAGASTTADVGDATTDGGTESASSSGDQSDGTPEPEDASGSTTSDPSSTG